MELEELAVRVDRLEIRMDNEVRWRLTVLIACMALAFLASGVTLNAQTYFRDPPQSYSHPAPSPALKEAPRP